MYKRLPDSTVKRMVVDAIKNNDVPEAISIVSDIMDMHLKAFCLAVCVTEENLTAIKSFLQQGCDPFLKHRGVSALARCCQRNQHTVLHVLLEEYLPLAQYRGDSRLLYRIKRALDEALFEAASFCSTDCVQYLLEAGAGSNSYSYHDDEFLSWCPPIIAACYATVCKRAANTQVIETVRVLIQYGADVSKENHMKDTALHWTAAGGIVEVARLLICNGADLNHVNSDGKTPFMTLGEFYGTHNDPDAYMKIAEVFLKHGADLEIEDSSSWRAIHYALQHCAVPLVSLLLRSGARTESSTNYVQLPEEAPLSCLSLAIKLRKTYIVKILLEWNADVTLAVTQVGVPCVLKKLDIAVMLYHAGGPGLEVPLDEEQLQSVKVEVKENHDYIVNNFDYPRSLQRQCRISIRRSLGRRVTDHKLCLPLPPALVSYIKTV